MADRWSPGASGRRSALDLGARIRVVQAAYCYAQHDLDTVLLRPTLFDPADPVTP